MQYSKCQECIHNGNKCKMVMAQTMGVIGQIEHLVNYSQTKQTDHKCIFKCCCSCENFSPKAKKLHDVELESPYKFQDAMNLVWAIGQQAIKDANEYNGGNAMVDWKKLLEENF